MKPFSKKLGEILEANRAGYEEASRQLESGKINVGQAEGLEKHVNEFSVQAIIELFDKSLPEKKKRPTYCCNNEGGVICWKESKIKAYNQALDDVRAILNEGSIRRENI